MSDPARLARRHVLDEHEDVVRTVLDCADAVADGWPEETAGDRDAVVGPLTAALDRTDTLARLPAVLAGAVEAAGYALPAPPVAAPPYVVVTSRGPVLRATVEPGRLLVRVDVFAVGRDGAVRYRRTGRTPESVVRVELTA